MLSRILLSASRSDRLHRLVRTHSLSRPIVARFVAGESIEAGLDVSGELVDAGLSVTLAVLGENALEPTQTSRVRDAYVTLLDRLADEGRGVGVEVSLKLSAIGQSLRADGDIIALENAGQICEAAQKAGTAVTLDMEDHTTTDSTLAVLMALRKDFPFVGAVLQAHLRRTVADCRDLAYPGSRVRLCKGAYAEPVSVAYQSRTEVNEAYVDCLDVLMAGPGYPMIASHDPRLIRATASLAPRYARAQGTYEYQMLYGIRPQEQRRLADAGETVRVYVPYGPDWYRYFVRRLAERPANLGLLLRALVNRR